MGQELLSIALVVTLCIAVACAILAGALVHGVLRPQLEGRGVKPWRVRDTLASIPLILIGSAGVGGSVSLAAHGAASAIVAGLLPWLLFGGIAGLFVSAFVLLLGVIALRKLAA